METYSNSKQGQMQISQEGKVQGVWLDVPGGQFALLAKSDDGAPYVSLELKGNPYPIALTLQDGEPVLQIPCKQDVVHFVKISTILEHIESLKIKKSKHSLT